MDAALEDDVGDDADYLEGEEDDEYGCFPRFAIALLCISYMSRFLCESQPELARFHEWPADTPGLGTEETTIGRTERRLRATYDRRHVARNALMEEANELRARHGLVALEGLLFEEDPQLVTVRHSPCLIGRGY